MVAQALACDWSAWLQLAHVPNRTRQNDEAPAEGALGSRSSASGAGNGSQQSPGDQAHPEQPRGRPTEESSRPQSATSRQHETGGAQQHGDPRAYVNRHMHAGPQGKILPSAPGERAVQSVDACDRQPEGQTPIPHICILSQLGPPAVGGDDTLPRPGNAPWIRATQRGRPLHCSPLCAGHEPDLAGAGHGILPD